MALARLLGRRLLTVVPTVLLATFLIMNLVHLIPGDPAHVIAGDYATPERLTEIRQQLRLDEPLWRQYWDWLSGAIHGDLGVSLRTGESVSTLLGRALPATFHVVVAAMVLSVVVGVGLGVLAASRVDKRSDGVVTGLTTAGVAVPNFWLAMVLVVVFAIKLGWFPATGYAGVTSGLGDSIRSLVLPSIALGAFGTAEIARQTRSAMIEVLSSDYVRTHRAKGLSTRRIVWRHTLRNAGIPLITVVGLLVTRMISATVVVETVFAIGGTGALAADAVTNRDYAIIQGLVLVMVGIVLLTNLAVDVLYRLVDPRMRR